MRRILLLVSLVVSFLFLACGTKQAPPTNNPPEQNPPETVDPDPDPVPEAAGFVTAGQHNEFFSAASDTEISLSEGTTLSEETDDQGNVVYRINNGFGGIRCRCHSGCSGACAATVGPDIATCSGDCEGLSSDGVPCSKCSFHYDTALFRSSGTLRME